MTISDVSIIIPHYNRVALLREALASVEKFAGEVGQVVVTDDGSPRECLFELEGLLSESRLSGRMQLVRHERNRGGGAARNSAVKKVQTEWVFCLDSDNLLSPGLISSLRQTAIFMNCDAATPELIVFFRSRPESPTHAWIFEQRPVLLRDFFIPNWIVPPASGNYLFSHESWAMVGGYPEDYGPIDTWGFGLRQVCAGLRMVPAAGAVQFHRHGHPSYWRDGDQAKMREMVDGLIEETFSSFPNHETRRVRDMLTPRKRSLGVSRRGMIWRQDLYPSIEDPGIQRLGKAIGKRGISDRLRGIDPDS